MHRLGPGPILGGWTRIFLPGRLEQYCSDWRRLQPPQPWRWSRCLYAVEHAVILTTKMPVGEATRLLRPLSMEVGAEAISSTGDCDVVISFGYLRDVRPTYTPTWCHGSYLEFIVGLPFVRWCGQTEQTPFGHVVFLYLNSLPAMLAGRLIGLPKHLATIHVEKEEFSVHDIFTGAPILSVRFADVGDECNPFRDKRFDDYASQLERLAVSRAAWRAPLAAEITFDKERARMRPVVAEIEVVQTGTPGLAPGLHRFESIGEQSGGACRLFLPWKLKVAGYHDAPKAFKPSQIQPDRSE